MTSPRGVSGTRVSSDISTWRDNTHAHNSRVLNQRVSTGWYMTPVAHSHSGLFHQPSAKRPVPGQETRQFADTRRATVRRSTGRALRQTMSMCQHL